MPTPPGFVLYHGPSLLTGETILAIVTLRSKNAKTGNMVQTWILRADQHPLDALKASTDDAICGDCPHRRSQGGACYVNVGQAPSMVYKAWARGSYPEADDSMAELMRGRHVRLGAYGDPMAVPAGRWQWLLQHAAGHTGYTHQWRLPHAEAYRGLVMASCDTPADYALATSRGWRTFNVLGATESPPARTFECLSDAKGTSCEDCGACDGAKVGRDIQAASVWIRVHGTVANRFESATGRRPAALRVLA
jgi:hypothetical protein